jgi:ubiquinone/menaquinone biosynthesis C-methylase UbiE
MSMTMYAFVGKLRLRDWMLAFRPWRGDEVVVDIGAGRGLMSIGAAKMVPKGKVIAVDVWRQEDLTGNNAESLTANAIAEGVDERIQIKTADARELSLETSSADVVLSVLCLHNIEPEADRMKACREIIRVLKPGGQALIADYIGVASYAREFKAAGLHVVQPMGAFLHALGLMRLVIVTRN